MQSAAHPLPSVPPSQWSHALPLAEVKRVLERAAADPAYLALVRDAPAEALAVYGYTWDGSELADLVAVSTAQPLPEPPPGSLLEAYRNHVKSRMAWRDEMRAACPSSHAVYNTWRERQKKRVFLELGPQRADTIIHAPMCFELNKGCSVGCWFCGISAPKLSDIWPATADNRSFWRATLGVLRDVIGRLTRYGFCYWATDPLDNPDYETFVADFHDVLGAFPQTTTALALRDAERTRRLVRMSEEGGCLVNRFSILSLKKLLEVHEAFTADELLNVECIPQNPESGLKKAQAGKAIEQRERKVAKDGTPQVTDQVGTIACVSGFLFNMVDRSMKLVTPCAADPRWPLGYQVLDEAVFRDVPDLEEKVRAMISRLPVSVKQIGRLRFARFLKMEKAEDGFEVRGTFAYMRVHDRSRAAWLQAMGDLIASGQSTADDIALLGLYAHGVPADVTLAQLERFFEAGMLDEEPPATTTHGAAASAVEGASPPMASEVPAARADLDLFDPSTSPAPLPPAPPSTSDDRPADAYLGLFGGAPVLLPRAAASLTYHEQSRQPSDDVIWLSHLRAPCGPVWPVLAQHGIAPRGVLHVGAHWGLELEGYIAAGFERIVFVEPSPLVLPHLRAHVEHWIGWFEMLRAKWGLPRQPRIEIIERAASNRRGAAEMHLAELEMLSSLHAPSEAWIKVQDTVTVECDTLDAMLAERGLAVTDFSVLNIDVQGHELEALQGASGVLAAVDAVLVELNERPRYHGCAPPDAVDGALVAAGLRRVGLQMHGDGAVGDALYLRLLRS